MKSKTEIKSDKEFEKLGVRPRVYHFTDGITPFTAITTAIAPKPPHRVRTWNEIEIIVKFDIEYTTTHFRYDHASELIRRLKRHDIKGVAICDKRDQFNRQRGRIIAKGRLLKHLKKG